MITQDEYKFLESMIAFGIKSGNLNQTLEVAEKSLNILKKIKSCLNTPPKEGKELPKKQD